MELWRSSCPVREALAEEGSRLRLQRRVRELRDKGKGATVEASRAPWRAAAARSRGGTNRSWGEAGAAVGLMAASTKRTHDS